MILTSLKRRSGFMTRTRRSEEGENDGSPPLFLRTFRQSSPCATFDRKSNRCASFESQLPYKQAIAEAWLCPSLFWLNNLFWLNSLFWFNHLFWLNDLCWLNNRASPDSFPLGAAPHTPPSTFDAVPLSVYSGCCISTCSAMVGVPRIPLVPSRPTGS